jgi:hypothetical protein
MTSTKGASGATSQSSHRELASVLARFSAVDPEAIRATDLERRYEAKRVASLEVITSELARSISTHAIVMAAGRTIARYHTLYFDTPSRDLYLDHVRGVRPRRKVRIREHLDRAVAFLEVKTREAGGMVRKERITRAANGRAALDARELDFVERVCRADRAGARSMLASMPVLSVSFQRIMLVHRTSGERVTFDLAISFGTAERRLILPELAVMELKTASRASAERFEAETAPPWTAGFSKYCLGTALLEPRMPAHRWRASLNELVRSYGAPREEPPRPTWAAARDGAVDG